MRRTGRLPSSEPHPHPVRDRLRGFAPGLDLLLHYQREWLLLDVLAGVTVGAMLIPQSMGYAALAGLPPQYGFFAAVPALTVYAFVGSSRHLGIGPEPGTAVLAAAAVAPIAANDPARYALLMAALAIAVGCVSLLAAVVRLGHLASLLSKPALVGYITGVGLVLLSSQIAGFTGVSIDADMFTSRWWELISNVEAVNGFTLSISAATLIAMLLLRCFAPKVPGALVAVLGATVAATVFSLERRGVALVGAIPSELPKPSLPSVNAHDVSRLLPGAAAIALVGFSDNVLTARSIARDRGYRVDPNQELVALGAINLASGLSQGFPVSSSASRTVVPAALGSRTQLVSLIAALFVLLSVVLLRDELALIPRAALSAVIVAAAVSIIDLAGCIALWRFNRTEGLLALVTAAAVILFGVLPGIVLAISMSLLVALARIARPHDAVLGDLPGLDGWVDIDEFPNALAADGLLVFRFDAPVFFLNVERFVERIEQALRDNPGDEDWLVIDCEGIGSLDASAVDGISALLERLTAQGMTVALAWANDPVLELMRRAHLLSGAGPLRVYPTINGAVRAFRDERSRR